jgi:CDGSH-type Zn-finger protein
MNIRGSDKKSGKKRAKIVVSKNGPYIVSGGVPLKKEIIVADREGIPVRWSGGMKYPDKKSYSLCRCGASKKMPYCDGEHVKTAFDGTERAPRKPYLEQAETYRGPGLVLTDAEKLCAIALFCHRGGDAWNLTERSGDPAARDMAVQECCDCPSGRLVAWDKKMSMSFEPAFPQSIGLVEDPVHHVSGPVWVKGNVPIESHDGASYEARNRVTLCRCGRSMNKPFCDGNHISSNFSDGDESIRKKD